MTSALSFLAENNLVPLELYLVRVLIPAPSIEDLLLFFLQDSLSQEELYSKRLTEDLQQPGVPLTVPP